MSSNKRLFFISLFSLVLCFSLATFAFADEFGLDTTAGAAGLDKYGANLPDLIGKVIGTMLSLVGVIFFALMIYGGFLWMQARGNEEHTKKGLDTIIAAVIGIIIVMSAYAITNFVFKAVVPAAPAGGGAGAPGQTPPEEPTSTEEYCFVEKEDKTKDCIKESESIKCVGTFESREECLMASFPGLYAWCNANNNCNLGMKEGGQPCPGGWFNTLDECKANLGASGSSCKSAADCQGGTSCLQGKAGDPTKKCLEPIEESGFCVSNDYCASGLKCDKSVCKKRVAGDSCAVPGDCGGKGAGFCVKGKCTTGAKDAKCVVHADCKDGLYCDLGATIYVDCQPKKAAGTSCKKGYECLSGTCTTESKCS